MDAEKFLTLKLALRYLDERHGLKISVVTMRKKRAKGTAPHFFIPDGARDLLTTASELDRWVHAGTSRAPAHSVMVMQVRAWRGVAMWAIRKLHGAGYRVPCDR